MAAAVQAAPSQLGGLAPHELGQYDQYPTGMSVLEDSDDGDMDGLEDMEDYYQQQYHQQHMQQQQQLMHQQGMQYNHDDDGADMEDEEMYSDESSDESVLPDENIDFGLIYALHTFLATVEGQASVVKGDSLLLLDDANSYWWLVRVLKTEDVGYIPAENVETPFERLARLNKHRNIDVAASTEQERTVGAVQGRENKLKSLIGWKNKSALEINDDDNPEEREGRRVVFAPPTYVEHPGVTWSSDEEDDDEDEDGEHELDLDHHEEEQDADDEAMAEGHLVEDMGYEPDDGVEWAQDAVEALRNAGTPAAGSGSLEAANPDTSATDGRLMATPENTPAADVGPSGSTAHLRAPDRSPSPAAPTSALARTNPTPPPHRAPAPMDASSPEPPARDITATPSTFDNHAAPATPVSSDIHTPTSPMQSTPIAGAAAAFAGVVGLAGATIPSSVSDQKTKEAELSPSSTSDASLVSASSSLSPPSQSTVTTAPPLAPLSVRRPVWQRDAFDISRLTAIVRMRAEEAKRTARPKRVVETDEVQRRLYGAKLEMDAVHPDIRASYVHLQAKMDAFDREVDDLLGALVGAVH